MMGNSKKALNRPKKRTLVRWDENLNELLLLCVQSVCNAQSIKIPWAEVAKIMGNNVTEGAIVQHLAKLRSRRADAGKNVPPPLRRGGIGAAIKPSKPSTGSKRKARRSPSESDDEASVQFECDDASSDEDYTEKRRPKRKPKMAKKRGSILVKEEPESDPEQDDREKGTSSEELLVPGASFLDFPNSDVSEDSSVESSPGPARQSKIVVLKYRRQTAESQQLVIEGEEEVALLPTEAAPVDGEVADNLQSEQTMGVDFNVNMLSANHELANPDSLLFQPFEAMSESAYEPHDRFTYEPPLDNHSEFPTGMTGQDFFLNDGLYYYQDLLSSGGNMDFS